jgi:hypothetical protein
MADEQLTAEEREEAAREEAGRELLRLIRADRQRHRQMREWRQQQIEAGYKQREEERRQREDDR